MGMAPHEEEQGILDTDLGTQVGGRQQVLSDGIHHPEGILLLQEEQETGSHLTRAGNTGLLPKHSCESEEGFAGGWCGLSFILDGIKSWRREG